LAVQQLAARLGRTPTMADAAAAGVSRGASVRLFGSWSAGIAGADLPPAEQHDSVPRDDVLTAFNALAARVGRTPTDDEFTLDPNCPSLGPVTCHFGSWVGLVRAAGMIPLSEQPEWTQEDVIPLLQELVRRVGGDAHHRGCAGVRSPLPRTRRLAVRDLGRWARSRRIPDRHPHCRPAYLRS